jgi:hypothetical protein
VALEKWAKSQFRSVPQLVSAIVKRALLEKNQSEVEIQNQK